MTNIIKVEIMVVDHDGLGAEEISNVINNCTLPGNINPKVMNTETKSVDWDDSHPLNRFDFITKHNAFCELFEVPNDR